MRILIAEDDRVSAKILRRELDELGHEVVHCRDGQEAWEAFQREPFAVVITDWVMPKLEGPELCRRVRSLWSRGYAYVILLTSRADSPEDRATAMRAGADDFLSKPFHRLDLHARLASAARIVQMHTQVVEQNAELLHHRQELSAQHEELQHRERQIREAFEIAEIARNRFSQLFESLPVAAFTFDSSGTVFEWNQRAAEIFSTEPHVAMGQKLWQILGNDLVDKKARDQVRRLFTHGEVFQNQDWNNGELFLLIGGYPLYSAQNEITGGIGVAIDVSKQRQAEAKVEAQNQELARINAQLLEANMRLEALATQDGLTGIPNHRTFQEQLGSLLRNAKAGLPLSLAMIDVDHFKQFNDTYGHRAGDEVLQAVATRLKRSIRRTDIVARYGGEEFCALFPGASIEIARRRCEEIRDGIENIQTPYRTVTASFGVCQFTAEMATAEGFIEAADIALYEAKHTGRNRVVVYEPSMDKRKQTDQPSPNDEQPLDKAA